MPAAYKAINPRSYYVRPSYAGRYGYRGYGQAGQPPPGAFEAGQQFAQNIVGGIGQIMQQRRMDEVANQILAKQYGVNVPQKVGFNWWGGGGGGGGMAELQLRQQMAQQDLADQLKRAQIANYIAMTQGTGRYAKPQPPQPGQPGWHQSLEEQKQQAARDKAFVAWQQKNALNAPKLAGDFDKTYGKGNAEKFYNAVTAGTGLRGNFVNGQFIPDENGEYYTYDADKAQGTPAQGGFLGLGATPTVPATAKDLKGTLIKYNDLQSYVDKLQQIQDAGGTLYPTQYPKEMYGPAPRAQLFNAPPPSQAASQGPTQAQTNAAIQEALARNQFVSAGRGVPAGYQPPFSQGMFLNPATGNYEPLQPSQAADQDQWTPEQAEQLRRAGLLKPPAGSAIGQLFGQDTTAVPSLPTPQTQDDYDAIPSGSDFIDVDGIQKTKT